MNTSESLDKLVKDGIVGVCGKHGERVYFDASQDCPTCAEKPKVKPKGKLVVTPVKVEETIEEPKGLLDRFKAMSTRKKAVLIGIAIVIMWGALNFGAIASYFK